MTVPFVGFPKMPRLQRDVVITEKIDGTNAQIHITKDGDFYIGSRKRWITPSSDNFGFAQWATENKEELMELGPGPHFGEWWGQGIQRRYGLEEKRFSLFNTLRWASATNDLLPIPSNNPTADIKYQEYPPDCCHVVPEMYRGPFNDRAYQRRLEWLKISGSWAAPGFMNPEGIVVYHLHARMGFKVTIDDDHKG